MPFFHIYLLKSRKLNPAKQPCPQGAIPWLWRPKARENRPGDEGAREILGSLSNNVLERRTSTGSGLFSFFDSGFAQIFSQIASITVKKLRNTNFISSRHVKRENTSLPVDVRRSKTSLLKLPILSPNSRIYN